MARFDRRLGRLTILPDVGLGGAYLGAWAMPTLLGPDVVSWLILGIELEAVALLGAYVITIAQLALLDRDADWRTKLSGAAIAAAALGFTIYQVLHYAFWWPALALLALLANRLAGLLAKDFATEDAQITLFHDALWGVGTYVVAIAPTFYLPVPSVAAITALSAEHAHWCALPADLVSDFFDQAVAATWCEEPHRALAGGALYFFVSALRGARRVRRASN